LRRGSTKRHLFSKTLREEAKDRSQLMPILVEVCLALTELEKGNAWWQRDWYTSTAHEKLAKGGHERDSELYKHIDNLHYILHDKATPYTVPSNDGNTEICRDAGRDKETPPSPALADFAEKSEAKECHLSLIEVAALRLYTSTSFWLFNSPLRASAGKTAEELSTCKHPLAVTTYHITQGLKKLRAVNFRALTKTRSDMKAMEGEPGEQQAMCKYLWRGLKNMETSDQFMTYGGSELACMSTSESVQVIAGYARSMCPLLFRIKIESPMDRGASLKWLSMFPAEGSDTPARSLLQACAKRQIASVQTRSCTRHSRTSSRCSSKRFAARS
jgi:hypothetical protein